MADHIYKKIELVGSSPNGIEEAVKNALTQDPNTPYALNRIRVSGGVDIRKFAENMGGPLPETVGC